MYENASLILSKQANVYDAQLQPLLLENHRKLTFTTRITKAACPGSETFSTFYSVTSVTAVAWDCVPGDRNGTGVINDVVMWCGCDGGVVVVVTMLMWWWGGVMGCDEVDVMQGGEGGDGR